jgi:hexosaminidase
LVRIDAPRENLIIRYTTDGSEPSLHSERYQGPFEILETLHLKAAAFDPYGTESNSVKALFEKQEWQASVEPGTLLPGIKYSCYERRFKSANRIDQNLLPTDRGVLEEIGVVQKNGEDDAGLVLEGFIAIPKDGVYKFTIASDDGSVLWIGDDPVVDHDGFHSGIDRHGNMITESGQIALRQGHHPIKIKYFDWGGGEYLKLFIEGPGMEKSELREEQLFH